MMEKNEEFQKTLEAVQEGLENLSEALEAVSVSLSFAEAGFGFAPGMETGRSFMGMPIGAGKTFVKEPLSQIILNLCRDGEFQIFLYNTKSNNFMKTAENLDSRWDSWNMIPSDGYFSVAYYMVKDILNVKSLSNLYMEVEGLQKWRKLEEEYADWQEQPYKNIGETKESYNAKLRKDEETHD